MFVKLKCAIIFGLNRVHLGLWLFVPNKVQPGLLLSLFVVFSLGWTLYWLLSGSVRLVSVCLVSPVFRIVNGTSTEASLAPGIDQLYSTNSWQGVHKVHNVVQLGLTPEFAWGSRSPARFLVLVCLVQNKLTCDDWEMQRRCMNNDQC